MTVSTKLKSISKSELLCLCFTLTITIAYRSSSGSTIVVQEGSVAVAEIWLNVKQIQSEERKKTRIYYFANTVYE